jgi:hypothetical protein
MLYGLLVRHLHDDRQLAPFQVEGIIKPSSDWRYLIFWGVAGVALGSLLPWIDTLWEETMQSPTNIGSKKEGSASPEYGSEDEESDSDGIFGADWTPVVRSVGAFVGIAYAIVRLPTLPSHLLILETEANLTAIVEKTPLGLHTSSFPHFSASQPRTLVYNRPLEARLHTFRLGRSNRYCLTISFKPRDDAQSRIVDQELHNRASRDPRRRHGSTGRIYQ